MPNGVGEPIHIPKVDVGVEAVRGMMDAASVVLVLFVMF